MSVAFSMDVAGELSRVMQLGRKARHLWHPSTASCAVCPLHVQALISVYLACTCAYGSSFIFSSMKVLFDTVGPISVPWVQCGSMGRAAV